MIRNVSLVNGQTDRLALPYSTVHRHMSIGTRVRVDRARVDRERARCR
jgi:hypothetical protein